MPDDLAGRALQRPRDPCHRALIVCPRPRANRAIVALLEDVEADRTICQEGQPMKPIVVAVVLLFAQPMSGPGDDEEPPRSRRTYSVEYVVEGTIKRASLSYLDDGGGMQQREVTKIPWSVSFEMRRETEVYIRAEKQGSDGGDVTVRILVNGNEYWRSEASGADTIATARGECCIRPTR